MPMVFFAALHECCSAMLWLTWGYPIFDTALQQWHEVFHGVAQALFWVFFKAQYMLAEL